MDLKANKSTCIMLLNMEPIDRIFFLDYSVKKNYEKVLKKSSSETT